ncbi:hypothetical protein [Shewanella surugensis]|jgi:hypothetical protein|uniref:Transposase n=1 Tax=Shewanella surugensis TaxID=212020 RepID=A0ABT0LJZ0_9GAMM|nr:hypothetical protein [Shewanella surugensis]MCL1127690.1 hypothetical protein [Shewanella surugensis]
MDISESLSILAAEFSAWRKQKTHAKTHVPKTLRQQAVSLLERYQAGQITSALSITSVQLTQWRQALEPGENPSFIELSPQASSTHSLVTLELNFNSGEKMHLKGIDNQMLLSIIGALKS